MIVLFAEAGTNRKIVKPGTTTALPIDGRVFVQEPNTGHLFAGDRDRPYRLSKIQASELIRARTGAAMAALLRNRVAANHCVFPPYGDAGCRSHLVFVNEIDHRFAERPPNLATAAWRRPKAKRPKYVPRPRPGQPGYELGRAMRILAATPFPGGGTYADRVHFYIWPGVISSIGVGRGRFHNLGRDGKPHFRSYEGVRPALQLAGGLWLEMYHFTNSTRTRYPFNTREWALYPSRFARLVTAPGARAPSAAVASRVHFLMTRGMPARRGGAPGQCARATTPQACQFALAALPANAAFLANGVGQYRMEGNEAEWGAQIRARFFR